MKDLIRRILLFFGGLAACFVAASVYFELRVRQQDDFFRQIEHFRDPDVKPVVLLVGDSRMATNVDQRHLPPGFYNFSYPGETLRHIYLRVKYALETKPSIEYIVLGLEDVGFSNARARLRDATQQMLFADLVDLTEVYPSSPKFLLRHAVLHYLPLVNAVQRRRTWEALVADITGLSMEERSDSPQQLVCGNIKLVGQAKWPELDEPKREDLARREVAELLDGSASNPEMHAVLELIIEEAHRHDVKVIGVRNPVSGPYIKAAADYYKRPVLGFLDEDRLLAVLDHETLFADRPQFFYNVDHLNSRGAREYTKRLMNELRQLVEVDASAPHDCDGQAVVEARSWPYNDVLSPWVRTPACHNLNGDCGDLPRRHPAARMAVDEGTEEPSRQSRYLPPAAAQPRKPSATAASYGG